MAVFRRLRELVTSIGQEMNTHMKHCAQWNDDDEGFIALVQAIMQAATSDAATARVKRKKSRN